MNSGSKDTPVLGSPSEPTYAVEAFATLEDAELKHFWFSSRRRYLTRLLSGMSLDSACRLVLDVGCGTGRLSGCIAEAFPGATVVGADLFLEAVAAARARAVGEYVCADLERLPFLPAFDLVTAFDVIEHFDDDVAVLRQLRSVIRPAGRLVVAVPAHGWLWSDVDVEAHHRRRYSRAQLVRALIGAGFAPERTHYFMAPMVPLIIGKRLVLDRLRRTVGASTVGTIRTELSLPRVVNWAIGMALWPETALIGGRLGMPVGSSLVAIAQT